MEGRVQWGLLAILGVLSFFVIMGNWPVTTRFGVDGHWSSKRISVYEKAINFLSRHLQTRRLAREVASGATTDEEKLVNIFSWVSEHLQPTPDGFPVVDDHVWHIFVRGYGAGDQRTEAFAVLASYAGLPATSVTLHVPDAQGALLLAAAQSHGRTLVFDIPRHVLFRNQEGALASIEELQRDPELVRQATQGATIRGIPYERFVAQLDKATLRFSRMGNQRPWFRFRSELLRLLRTKS